MAEESLGRAGRGPGEGLKGPLCSLGAGSYILLWAPYVTNTYQHKQFMFFAENLENENKSKGKKADYP